MNLKPLYVSFKLFLIGIFALVVFVASVALWVMIEPRSLNHWNAYLESKILPEGGQYQLKLESSLLQWDGWTQPFSLHLKNTKLLSRGVQVMSWPELVVTADMWDLLFGNFEVKHLMLANPELFVVRSAEGHIYVKGDQGQHISLDHLFKGGSSAEHSLPVHKVSIYGADIRYEDQSANLALRAEHSSVEWSVNEGQQVVAASLPLLIAEQKFSIDVHAVRDTVQGSSSVKIGLKDINLESVCQVVPFCEGLPKLDMGLSGDVALRTDSGFDIHEVLFSLSGEDGVFAFEPHFPEALPIDTMQLSGKYEPEASRVRVERITLATGGVDLEGHGSFAKEENGYHVVWDANAVNMTVNDLYKYWPQGLAPESREWVTTSIRDGMATKASISISLQPEDFEPEFFPDDFLKAEVHVAGATVRYIPNYPEARNANGMVHFTGTTITIDANNAEMLTSTIVPSAKFHFSDLNHPNVPMTIDLAADGPAKDVITFISPPRFPFLKVPDLDVSRVKGNVSGRVKLAFDAFSNKPRRSKRVDWNAVTYDIDSEYNEVSGVVYRGATLNGARGTFKANNKKLNATIEGKANGSPISVVLEDSSHAAPTYRIKGTFDKKQLVGFGFPDRPEVQGVMGVKVSVSQQKGAQLVEAELDMTKAIITVDDLRYGKPSGVPAYLKVSTNRDGKGKLRAGSLLDFSSDALKFKGLVTTQEQTGEVQSVDLDYFRYGRNDVAVAYRPLRDGNKIQIKGAALDVSPLQNEKGNNTISYLPSVQLDINVDHLYLSNQRELKHVKGHLYCGRSRCQSAHLAFGMAKGGDVSLSIFSESGQRKFNMQCNDAGALLNVLEVTDRMHGGGLIVNGNYDDHKRGNPLDGRFTITDFTLKNAPILGRILNMSSLTGLVESLSGSGIKFDKLAADFVFANDVANIKNGKATGASLGILSEGTIDIHNSTISMDGSLAPAYMLNSFVGKIPLIGKALVGGEGEGVFAFSYSVKGNSDNPDVSVNPLSVLTPGFMRKFFDIFDTEPVAKPVPREQLAPIQEFPAQEPAPQPGQPFGPPKQL